MSIIILYLRRSYIFLLSANLKMRMFALYVFIVCLFIQCKCEDSYSNKYDGVDLGEILASDRLLAAYVNCLLDSGPCTPDAKELKKNLPDAIENDCKKCNTRQRDGADEVMHYIIEHRPDDWSKLEKKYNSDGSYKQNYMAKKNKEKAVEKTTNKTEEKDYNIAYTLQ